MHPRRVVAGLIVLLCLLAFTSLRGLADEGFWPFNALPKRAVAQRYGFEPSDAWVSRLQHAAVRFGGASGSFVSPEGLILTNHHVGLRTIQRLSTPERDLVRDGFLAKTPAEELKAPDLEVMVLQSIEDVTARVNAAVSADMSPADAFAARRAAIAAIERASQDATGLRSEVVTLYQGALYHLYRYKVYDDVRLVFAPEFDVAFYGGDPDNFTYPRYCLDICFFRAYENGRPARTEAYLPWSPTGVRDGELVFAAGHPGATQRLNTVAHLEYLRDHGIPWTIAVLERRHAALAKYSARGSEEARQARDEIFSIENSLKSYRGQLAGLRDPALMAKKRDAERRLREAVAADPAIRARYGSAWDEVAQARRRFVASYKAHSLLESGTGFNSRYFAIARTVVRLVTERAKPEAERLAEFGEARIPALERQLFATGPIYPALEAVKLADSLALLAAELGASHPAVRAALQGQTPEARAAELVERTTLGDVAARKALVSGGLAAVEASTDPMVVLARAVDAEARAVRRMYEDEVASVEREAYARIAQAVFAVHGISAYPDATSTLRLSYGAVRGYEENGRQVPPFTDFAGLYARAAAHGNQPPYRIVERWAAKREALTLRTPFNFVSTLDIVGGNSGSPVVDRRGELVGVVFDGNIQSLPGYFIYDEAVNRAVAVDSRGILEALRVVYGANRLVAELTGGASSASR